MATSGNVAVISGSSSPGTVDDHELFFARRALRLLKERLGSKGLKTLLADDISRANEFWKSLTSSGDTTYAPFSITLQAQGISASEFLSWFKTNTSNLPVMLAAHPEHYINGLEVLETVGTYVSLFDLEFYPGGPPTFVAEKLREEDKYPICLAAAGHLQGNEEVVVGYACHQFRDLREEELQEEETKGLEAKLGGCMPEGVGDEVRELQTRHLLVEWRNWMREAVEDDKRKERG